MTIYDTYTNYCKTQINLDRKDWDFKSKKEYTYVLEHVSYQHGLEYLNEILSKYSHVIDKKIMENLCIENDTYGKPTKYHYEDFIECSPTSLRYILHALHTLNHIDTHEVNIIEIGGGYGGLCLCINRLSHLFHIKINSYTILDLPEPSALQSTYLVDLDNVTCTTLSEVKDLKHNSFLVSTYSFSEIDLKYQKEYTEKVLNKYVNHGFIVWNFINIYDFIENKQFTIHDEVPLTGNNFNKYVYF